MGVKMRRSTRLVLAAALLLGLAPFADAPATASCGDVYPAMALGPFPDDALTTTPLFYASDDAGSGTFSVRWTGFSCGRDLRVDAEYSDTPGSATEPADYLVPQGQRTPQVCESSAISPGCPSEATVSFPVTGDALVEQVTEELTIVLSNPGGGSLDLPSSAPFVLVDANGPARVAFDELPYSGSESYETLAVAVWRGGPTVGTTEVPYTTAPGANAPATADADYSVTSPNPLVFGPGDRVELITLKVTNDELTEGDETVDLVLQTPNGALLDTPGTKTVTIKDNEESIPPQSRFHHPRQGLRYRPDDFRIREIHVFTSDQGGSDVVSADIALRRNNENGRCAWWTGRKFKRGPCSDERWIPLHRYEPDFFYQRFDALRPSAGTSIEDYTAYARARDGAGNVEKILQRGRNANTFEIKGSKRT